jgi:cytochrome c peroxidase
MSLAVRKSVRCGVLLLVAWCFPVHASEPTSEPIQPIPLEPPPVDAREAALGEKLFNDPRLARNDALACASCHQLAQGGDDGLSRSVTNKGEADVVNAPTVFNAVFNYRQTWRGAFDTLEQQADDALQNMRHGNNEWDDLLAELRAISEYRRAFDEIYPDGLTRASVLAAIASYERTLVTPNSRFDRWLRGERDALTAQEQRGYQHFKAHGCASCHQGTNVGGNLMMKLGVFEDYFKLRGGPITPADLGRYQVTGEDDDRHVFRVAPLRNVAVTAPYFHDGSVTTLGRAVELMTRLQLGVAVDQDELNEQADIVAFLKTLTGEYRGRPLDGAGQSGP